ncbi:MAG: NAD(P)H-hydrate epimerase [Phycisphaerales bacterium]|nr:NAD(P)H-hydrate epimerase [Phycisphaerales bacterium]
MSIPYPPGEALTVQQIRDLDVLAIEHVGIPGIVLMENAGRACAELVYAALLNPARERVVILCGPGNNGGDGFVIARHLANSSVDVAVVLAAPPEQSRGDAGTNLRILERMGVPLVAAVAAPDADSPPGVPAAVRERLDRADLVIDALLGSGARGAPRGILADLIRLANAAPRARRVAIDVPSGLCADTGEVFDPCFRAEATITMVAAKIGFDQPAARAVLGRVVAVDIGVPQGLIPGREPAAERA